VTKAVRTVPALNRNASHVWLDGIRRLCCYWSVGLAAREA
jgi:hypothetical protein